MSVLRKDSYKEILKSAETIKRIYSEKKIRIRDRSYIYKCLESAYKLYDSWKKGDYGIIQNGTFSEILPYALECHRIGVALGWVERKQGLEGKLKLMLKKSIHPYYRSKKNIAKDTAFEVFTMARFEKAGLEPRFEEPDIIFQHGDNEFSVACKFAHSEQKLNKNIKKAAKQIEKSNKLGVIAVCIDEISPQEVMHNSAAHFDTYLNEVFGRLINRYNGLLNRIISSRQVIGLIMSYSTAIIIKDIQLPAFVDEWGVAPRCYSESPEFANLREIVDKLNSINIKESEDF